MKQPKIQHLHAFAGLTAIALLSLACVGTDGEPMTLEGVDALEAEAATEADTPAARPDAQRDRRAKHGKRGKRGKGGIMGLLKRSVEDLDLDERQRAALTELRKDIKGSSPRDHEAQRAFHAALLSAVEAGDVDVADFADDLSAIETGAAAKTQALQKMLDGLHSTLTAGQRAELVDSMDSALERGRKHKGDAKPGATRGKDRSRGHSMLRRIAKKLNLSDEQMAKLREASEAATPAESRASHDESRAKMREMVRSFANDDFDAAAAGVGTDIPKHARRKAEGMLNQLAVLVPILDEAQRAELAQLIERKRGKRGPGKR
jgi:Spy/CpxP family protein refolding chaperone